MLLVVFAYIFFVLEWYCIIAYVVLPNANISENVYCNVIKDIVASIGVKSANLIANVTTNKLWLERCSWCCYKCIFCRLLPWIVSVSEMYHMSNVSSGTWSHMVKSHDIEQEATNWHVMLTMIESYIMNVKRKLECPDKVLCASMDSCGFQWTHMDFCGL